MRGGVLREVQAAKAFCSRITATMPVQITNASRPA